MVRRDVSAGASFGARDGERGFALLLALFVALIASAAMMVSAAALRMGPHGLAAEIMRIAEKAQRNANSRLHQSLERVVDPRELTELGIERERDEDEFGWRR